MNPNDDIMTLEEILCESEEATEELLKENEYLGNDFN